MQELTARDVNISDFFWSPHLTANAHKAIFHQWEQPEASRCIDNFRIVAGEFVTHHADVFGRTASRFEPLTLRIAAIHTARKPKTTESGSHHTA